MAADDLVQESRGEAPGRGRLEGRRILVVGGGQEDYGLDDPPIGNGRAISLLCGREGAHLACADREMPSVEETPATSDGTHRSCGFPTFNVCSPKSFATTTFRSVSFGCFPVLIL